jgi:membrane fusion protein (multidrug efflux system)
VIPQESTFEVQQKLCVFVVGKNNAIEMRTVVPKVRVANHFVIESGLKAEDKIVYQGIQLVKEGDVIKPEFKVQSELAPLIAAAL